MKFPTGTFTAVVASKLFQTLATGNPPASTEAGRRILDAGCGTGQLSIPLTQGRVLRDGNRCLSEGNARHPWTRN